MRSCATYPSAHPNVGSRDEDVAQLHRLLLQRNDNGGHPLGRDDVTTLYVSHPAALDHAMPAGHPESAERIRAVDRVLEDERFAGLVRGLARPAGAFLRRLWGAIAVIGVIHSAGPPLSS